MFSSTTVWGVDDDDDDDDVDEWSIVVEVVVGVVEVDAPLVVVARGPKVGIGGGAPHQDGFIGRCR